MCRKNTLLVRMVLPNPNTAKGSLFYLAIIFGIMIILHVDFWNWGPDQWTFLGWNQEFLYRGFFIVVLIPIVNYVWSTLVWPLPEELPEEIGGDDGESA